MDQDEFRDLEGLEFKRMRGWLSKARENEDKDAAYAFICAWIGFNYYYGTYSRFHGIHQDLERAKWQSLVQKHKGFRRIYSEFLKDNPTIFNQKLLKPIPGSTSDASRWGQWLVFRELPREEIFEQLYVIRNNLFHGLKYPDENERDRELCSIGANFLISFLERLVQETEKGLPKKME